MTIDLNQANQELTGKSPGEIIAWGLETGAGRSIISTNFRPHEAVLLHMVTRQQPDIPVLWADHGYNTPDTYRCAEKIIELLSLNIRLYLPLRSRAHRDTVNGGIPSIEDQDAHDAFTREVKLEPFQRGLDELNPLIWFTALRREQTELRAGLEIVTPHTGEVLKVSPLLDWTEADMNAYLEKHNLPSEDVYYDPTKVLANRECGLHLSSDS